jgi:hypothetical protein
VFRATASSKEYHPVHSNHEHRKKTAKIAAISTCSNKNLHFSRIFQPIALAFSYPVRYSPLGSSFFAQFSRVDEESLQPARFFRDGKKSTGG